MLLPSALTCETTSTPKTRFQSALFASPPLSPSTSHSNPAHTILSTCRALQSMLTTPTQLPSPPTLHSDIPSSPFKLRLRARKDDATPGSNGVVPRKRITKRTSQQPPRGINKRRRALDDEMNRQTADCDVGSAEEDLVESDQCEGPPSTPKRMRFAPEVLPLGLERSDFQSLQLQAIEQGQNPQGLGIETQEGEVQGEWTTEEDRLLVELVLEKLKLTKSDWQDCARSLGRDRGSVGRRWKSLLGGGEVGLKRNHLRRGKIHQTWR